jgi:hypothetical protein
VRRWTRYVFKGRSLTFTTHNPDGDKEDFISISPLGGIQATDHLGNGFVIKDGEVVMFAVKPGDSPDCKSMVRLTETMVQITQKASDGSCSLVQLQDGQVCVNGKSFVAGVGQALIGNFAVMPAAIGPQPGAISTSVYIQA